MAEGDPIIDLDEVLDVVDLDAAIDVVDVDAAIDAVDLDEVVDEDAADDDEADDNGAAADGVAAGDGAAIADDRVVESVIDKAKTTARTSYTIGQKLKFLKLARSNNAAHVFRHHRISKRALNKWKQTEAYWRQQLRKLDAKAARAYLRRDRDTGGGKKVSMPELDARLLEWLKHERQVQKNEVKRSGLLGKAHELGSEMNIPTSKFTEKWLEGFFKRSGAKLYVVKRQTKKEPAEIFKLARMFWLYCRAAHTLIQFEPAHIFHFDEKPVSFAGTMERGKSVGLKGDDMVIKNTIVTSMDFKRCATYLPLFNMDGSCLREFLIFAGKGQVSRAERAEWSKDVTVRFNETSYAREEWFLDEFLPRWKELVTASGNKPHFLILDSCRSHLTHKVKKAFSDANTVIAVIKGGMTQFQQLLDLVVFSSWTTHYVRLLDEHLARMKPTKPLTASEKRVAMTHICSDAFKKVRENVDMGNWFVRLGYAGWHEDPDGARLRLRGFPDFRFTDVDPAEFGELKEEAERIAQTAVDKAFPPELSQRSKGAIASLPLSPMKRASTQLNLQGFLKRKGNPAGADGKRGRQ